MTSPPRLVLVLSENWTLVSPRDLRALVRMAVEAEEAGIDTVMLSEHVVMGPSSGADGIMGNPRDYAAAGQPGSGDAVARLDRAGERDRRGDLDDPHRAGRRDRAAAPSAAARQAARRRSTCWPRVASSCSRRCRGTRTSTRRSACPSTSAARSSTSSWWRWSAPGRRLARVVRGQALLVPRRVPRAEAVPARGAADVVRRHVAARRAAAPHRPVRPRLPPVRLADAGGAGAPRASPWPRPAATAPTWR